MSARKLEERQQQIAQVLATRDAMREQTLDEWQAEMKERFPGGKATVAFVCPSCGRVTLIAEFWSRGLDEQKAPFECIGRHVKGIGCDWAAYGLLRTLGKGRHVVMPEGDRIEVFDFAAEVASGT